MSADKRFPSRQSAWRRSRPNHDSIHLKFRRENIAQSFRHRKRSLAERNGNNLAKFTKIDRRARRVHKRARAIEFSRESRGNLNCGKCFEKQVLRRRLHGFLGAVARLERISRFNRKWKRTVRNMFTRPGLPIQKIWSFQSQSICIQRVWRPFSLE